MRVQPRLFLTAVVGLFCLVGCETTATTPSSGDFLKPAAADPPTAGATDPGAAEAIATAEAPAVSGDIIPEAKQSLGNDPYDDLSVAKKLFREGNYSLAERAFRRAVETNPRSTEGWVGLAASYDRQKRFDLADGAYAQALKLSGPTPAILNNQGHSYLLRGDYGRAREKLLAAQAKDPANPYISANLALLAESERTRKRSGS